MKCGHCNKELKLIVQHFPKRKPPNDKPFLHALYFNDPFFQGNNLGFCDAQCLNEHRPKKPAKGEK